MIAFDETMFEEALADEATRARMRHERHLSEAPEAAQRFLARLRAHPIAQGTHDGLQRAPAARPALPQQPRGWLLGIGMITALAASIIIAVKVTARPTVTDETLSARPGSRLSATLADGSHVELRGGSSIRVRMPSPRAWWQRWAATEPLTALRLVELTGEAQFDVVHDARHPFRVLAQGVIVDDIGTVFAVRAYPTDSALRVVVSEGAVSVQPRGGRTTENVQLVAGDIATIRANDAIQVVRSDSAAVVLSWTRDLLVFRDAPLPQVLRELELTFGRPIVVAAPELAGQHVTITLDARRLDAALRSISVLLNLTPQTIGDTLVLSSRSKRP